MEHSLEQCDYSEKTFVRAEDRSNQRRLESWKERRRLAASIWACGGGLGGARTPLLGSPTLDLLSQRGAVWVVERGEVSARCLSVLAVCVVCLVCLSLGSNFVCMLGSLVVCEVILSFLRFILLVCLCWDLE